MRSLVLVVALGLLVQGASAQTWVWLDKPLVPWNTAGASLPKAPPSKGESPGSPRCAGSVRQPDTASEGAVTALGWFLIGKTRIKGDTAVVLGEAAVDGMCRPWDYQAFVFERGAFAGTLAPGLMDSRTDGALSEIRLPAPTLIEAVFLRYVDADPLCCPSRLTTVRYRIDRGAGGPVVVPVSAQTKPAGNSK